MTMPKKLPVDELLRLACIYAEQDRRDFLAVYAAMPDDPAAIEAKEYLSQLRAYSRKRWGRQPLDAVLDTMSPMTPADIAAKHAPAEPWRLCNHQWGRPEIFTEPDFGVSYASQQVCQKCHARLFNNWGANRASGYETLLPPEGT